MQNSTKASAAYTRIRDGILCGEFLPGSHLVLADLEKKLGLGRGPIRDALMQLDRSGLIENIPFKGAIVKTPPSLRELEYIYKTRLTVEVCVVLEVLKKITPHHINVLQKMVDESLRDIDKFYKHDRKFHAYLYAIADMPHLQDIMNSLNEHIDIFLNTHTYSLSYRLESIKQHQRMVDAIQAKDSETFITALEANMMMGLDYIHSRLSNEG